MIQPPEHRLRLLARIRGEGIEIGALNQPLPLPRGARARHVDHASSAELVRRYPEAGTSAANLAPDILAAADLLPLGAETMDFVLCSHLLEHLPDPLGALKEWHRVLRPGGFLLVILPDHRFTFDRLRARTRLEHVVADHRDGAGHPARQARDFAHYEDWARWVNRLSDPGQASYYGLLLQEAGYPIHFHCWVAGDVRRILEVLDGEEGVRFDIEDAVESPRDREFAFLLRRPPSGPEA